MHKEASNLTKTHSQEVVAVDTTPGPGMPMPTPSTTPIFWQKFQGQGDFLEEVVFWLGP